MSQESIEAIKMVLNVLLPILGGLTVIMCSVVGYFGSEVIKQLREMAGHLAIIKEELKNEINSLDRRVIRLEALSKFKDPHLFLDRIGDENH